MVLNAAFRKAYYGIFWHHLKRQICSKTIWGGLERNLQTDNGHIPCEIEYFLLKGFERAVFKKFEKVREIRFLFLIRRRTFLRIESAAGTLRDNNTQRAIE
jgi:hypothetical protein